MKAWRVHAVGRFTLDEVATPAPGPGGVLVRMQASPVLSYMRKVLDGELAYALPPMPFIPGTNGVGTVEAVGPGVYNLRRGQRVSLNPHLVVDERVAAPAQILVGLTAMGAAGTQGIDAQTMALQRDWPDGTFAEFARVPASCLTPIGDEDALPASRLAVLSKFAVPCGGLLRGQLQAGETVIVNGASGYFGAAAVLLAIAMGAAHVVAVGRDRAALEAVRDAGGARVRTVVLSGETSADAASIRAAARGGAELALDIVGRADSASSTMATLRALKRRGRLVLMGSVSQPLPIAVAEMLANDWAIMGQFMYPKDTPARLLALIAAGLLDLTRIDVRIFALSELPAAMDAAARMRGLDATVLDCTQL